ncbi:hypothetical protein [Burkholderia glumae]
MRKHGQLQRARTPLEAPLAISTREQADEGDAQRQPGLLLGLEEILVDEQLGLYSSDSPHGFIS